MSPRAATPVILVAGLTPAWQRIMVFSRLAQGEVCRARETIECASGKPVNVALAVAALGGEARLVTLLGGAQGRAIEQQCREAGVKVRAIQTRPATRTCVTLVDESRAGQVTELVENAAPIDVAEIALFEQAVRDAASDAALVVLTGSLPTGAPGDLYARCIRGLSTPVLLDARGEELRAALSERPWLVKPNRIELANTWHHESSAAALSAEEAMSAQEQSSDHIERTLDAGAEHVLISDGPRALRLACAERGLWFVPPEVAVVNPIGSGDCLAAALALATVQGQALESAVRYGIGAAVDNAAQLLPARLDRQRVADYATAVRVLSDDRNPRATE